MPNIYDGIPGLDPLDPSQLSGEQLNMLSQMAGQVPQAPAGQVPAPPTNAPASQVPVTKGMKNDALSEALQQRLRQHSTDYQRELDQLREYAKNYAGMEQATDYRPLAAFAAGLPGGNKELMAAANSLAPETPQQHAEKVLQNQQGIAKLVGDQKATGDMLKYMQGQQRLGIMQGRNDIYGQRLGLATDAQSSGAVDKVLNDKQIGQYIPRIQGADRVLGQLNDVRSGKIVDTNQFLNDLNTEYVNLLTGANNSALGKQERTEYRTAAGDIASSIQRLKAEPESINSPKILQQLETSVQGLKATYQKNLATRAQTLQRNFPHNPQAQGAQQEAIGSLTKTYGTVAPETPKFTPEQLKDLSDEELRSLYEEHK